LAAESIQAGLESGDIQFVSYAMLWQSCNNYYQGMTLPDFIRELHHFSHFVHKAKDQLSIAVVLAETFALVDILGPEDNAWLPVSIDELNEEQYVKDCLEQEAFLPLCLYYIFKLQTSYVLNDYKKANEFATQADELLGHIFLALSVAEHNFYSSLTLAALYPEASEEEQRTYLQQLDSNQKQMKIWVDNCPENFLNMYLLVEAEIARIKGNDPEAMDLYDQAIASAHEEGFIQNEAIANELCAGFWMGKKKEEFSGLYMVKAHHCYHKWGARKKAGDLEEKYPQFISRSGYDPLRTISSTNGLDLSTVIKASQAISREIGMKSLLSRIMTIMIQNAGAQKGILFLNQENELIIKAIASGPDDIEILPFKPIENCKELPEAIVRYVFRTGEDVILHDAQEDVKFSKDAYIIENQPKSILSMPIRYHNEIAGVLYLENNLVKKTFAEDRIFLLNFLLSQAAISLENARFFEEKQKYAEKLTEEIAERKKAGEVIQKSNSLLSSIIESPKNIIMFALDTNYKYLSFNEAHVQEMKKVYGVDIEIGQYIMAYIPREDDRLKAETNYKRVLRGERFVEIQKYGEADNRFWYELIFNPIVNTLDQVTGFTVFVTDISERKKAEKEIKTSLKEKEVLLQEVHHRVKNNMQLIISILSLQGQQTNKTDAGSLEEIIARIRIFGDIHRRLYQQEDISRINFVQHLKENLQDSIKAYNIDSKNIDIEVDIANPNFELDQAVPCGLLMNELISNSLKHAFIDQGTISISITHDSDGELEEIVYSDTGKGIDTSVEGFGTKIIRALAQQLDMSVHISVKDGTRFDFIRKDIDHIIEKPTGAILYVEDEIIIAMDKISENRQCAHQGTIKPTAVEENIASV
ncbi:MAG: GAF domain-containing protein, partial [Cytophagales bacterium]|nr:GAF domain-containing protein [Cytophagales bacterium]